MENHTTSPCRATKTELEKTENDLGRWQAPTDFAKIVEKMVQRHGDYNLDQPGSAFRDAYVADICARERKADYVRLGADPPDFELCFAGRIELFETAEVIAPNRPRGDELKEDRKRSPQQPRELQHVCEDQFMSAACALDQIASVVELKVGKNYPKRTSLVLYLNIWPIADVEIYRDGIPAVVAPALAKFNEAWVWDNKEFRQVVWLDGAPKAQGIDLHRP